MKALIDDLTLRTHTEPELIGDLEKCFEVWKEHHLFLSVKKSVLYAEQVELYGKIINSSGYCLRPWKLSKQKQ